MLDNKKPLLLYFSKSCIVQLTNPNVVSVFSLRVMSVIAK